MKLMAKSAPLRLWMGLMFAVLLTECGGARNPLRKHGVQIEWKYDGATSSYPAIEVWAEYQGQRIDCPLVFGGINHPDLKFKDIDGDGIEEIIFGNRKNEQIVSFKPASGGSPPKFMVIKNNPESG